MIRFIQTAVRMIFAATLIAASPAWPAPQRGTGDLGLIIERASGSVLIFSTGQHRVIGRVEGLGDLSHASAVFSPDQRFGYIFGRDGGLSKVDMLEAKIDKRVMRLGQVGVDGVHDLLCSVRAGDGEHAGVHLADQVAFGTCYIAFFFSTQTAGNDDAAIGGQGFTNRV